jgi:uncharacterized membrane protein YfhO
LHRIPNSPAPGIIVFPSFQASSLAGWGKNSVLMLNNILASIRRSIYLWLSFLVPVLILGTIYATLKIFPFGPRTILAIDLSGQYIDFYEAFRRIMVSGGSLFYSWSKGLGGNIVGLEAYYLTSPFSLIALLFPEKYLVESMIAITLAKAGCSGLAMAVYLRVAKRAGRAEALIFSIPYALLSYFSGYSYNIMWLDGMVFLPWIALGIEQIIARSRCGLYGLALTVMLIANFYIGFMVSIFSGLYFFTRLFILETPAQARSLLRKMGLFFAASLVAAGAAAFLLVPTYFSLSTGKLDLDPNFITFTSNFPPLAILSKFLVGSYHSAFAPEPPPPLYCGISIVLLTGLYFSHPRISVRKRVFSALLLVILLGSMWIKGIDLVWHGLQIANGFPYRYAFTFGFFCISLAYDAYAAGIRISSKFLWASLFLGFGTVGYVFLSGAKDISRTALLVSCAFMVGYIFLFYGWERIGKVSIYILGTLVFIEAGINTDLIIRAVDNEFHYPDRVSYSRIHYQLQNVVSMISEQSAGFFRIEKTFSRSFNDSLGIGYHGVSHYSSLYDRDSQTFLRDIGFQRSFYRLLYVGAPASADSILGIKYLLSYDPLDNGYQAVGSVEIPNGNIFIYRNPYALPPGFLVNRDLAGARFERENPLLFQNQILKAMQGPGSKDCFSAIKSTRIELTNAFAQAGAGAIRYSKIDPSKDAFIEIHYVLENNQPLFGNLASPMDHDKVEIFWNDQSFGFYGEHREFNQLLNLGRGQPGSTTLLKLRMVGNKFVLNSPEMVYQLNMDCFSEVYSSLAKNPWEITGFTDSSMHGMVNSVSERPLLFTSIPYDEGWQVRLDGREVQKIKLLNAFIGVMIPPGAHQVDFAYTPPGLWIGAGITAFTLLLLMAVFWVNRSISKKVI